MIDRKKARTLALNEYMKNLNEYMEKLKETLQVYDSTEVPGLDTMYWAEVEAKEDFWYIQHPADLERPFQTGGESRYFAVSKQTGDMHVITIYGE